MALYVPQSTERGGMFRFLFMVARWATGVAAGLMLCVSSANADLTYDASADFTPSSTASNGVWSYGYRSTIGGALTPFDLQVSDPTFYGLTRTGNVANAPIFYRPTNGPIFGVPDGAIALHPGTFAIDTYAVLRFTSPVAGIYNVNASFLTGDSGVTDNFVLRNGSILVADTDDVDSAGSYSNSLFLGLGDTIELVVGNHGVFFSDSTPVSLVLTTSAVPEPTSMCLACSGLVAVAIRNRKQWLRKV